MKRAAEPHDSDAVRNPLVQHVEDVLTAARLAGESVGVLLVHAAAIDRVDARHGLNAGERLSSRIEELLRARVLRKGDSVEALSRDEFACILRPMYSEGVAMLAARRIMSVLGPSQIEFSGIAEAPDVAIGIAIFPHDAADAEGLLLRAKHALQTAHTQRDRISLWQPQTAAPVCDPSQYAQRLVRALDQNALLLHYMPQASLRSGRIMGAEALLRWTDELLGDVPAYAAVQAAEASGLIDRLTQWVVTSAVERYAEFQRIDPVFRVSLNISPSNLREPDFPYFVGRALRTWDLNGGNLFLEITENAMMSDPVAAIEVLHELKSHGVRLSIDDFGTGYSSMHYLAQLPLDELKIDLSFVRTMLESPVNAKIVRSLIELAHNLELSVVAEGAENEAVMQALAHLKCDYAQGYFVGKAVSAAQLAQRISRENGRS